MSAPKRPGGLPDSGTSTLITGPAAPGEEEAGDPAPESVEVDISEDESANDGSTAFLRAPAPRKPAAPTPASEQSPGSTVAMRAAPLPGPADDAPGGTAFVRLDKAGTPAGQQRPRKEQ